MSQTLLQLENATFGFDKSSVWDAVNFSIFEGEWISLLGPNGCGKSTFIKALLGVLPLRSGKRLTSLKSIGYVPQKLHIPNRFPLTLEEFLNFKGVEEEDHIQKEQAKLLHDLNLNDLIDRPLQEMSGGELQKSLLVFSLWDSPKILFLDEFLEGLDTPSMNNIIGYLENLHHEKKLSIVEASHDIGTVTHTASRVILLKNKVLYDGPPSDHGFHDCLHKVYGHHKWIKHEHV